MKKFLVAFVVCLAAGLSSGISGAQAEESARMNEVVVTATKAKTPKKKVTRAVSVVPGEGMGERKGGFLMDGLRSVPGVPGRRVPPVPELPDPR